MNKKFTTLLASALLVGSVSAYADVNADLVTKLEKGYYVLNETTAITTPTAVGSHFQMVDGKLKVVAGSEFTAGKYNKGLWTITASAENSNHFTFTNKAEGLSISFDPKTAVAADAKGVVKTPDTGSELTGGSMAWGWVANSDDKDGLGKAIALTYAFTTDSTMALGKATDGTVFAYKYANAKASSTTVTALTVQATKPSSVVMKAEDLNVLKDASKGNYFTMTPSKKNLLVDVISNVKFQAADVTGSEGYVALKELGTEKYLRVDTATHAATGLNENNLYKLDRKALKKGEDIKNTVPNHFKIEKDLFRDSVFVSIKQANTRFTYSDDATTVEAANGSHWSTALGTSATPYEYCTLSSILLTPTTEVMTFYSPKTPSVAEDGMVKENLLFAVSDAATAPDSKASVPDGLYYITNAKGQYLASPIYNNGGSAEWVTVNREEQNVAHMPAYQWVVLKDNSSSYAKDKSTVTLTNREFAEDVNAPTVQLYKNAGATYYYVASAVKVNSVNAFGEKDSLKFDQIKDLTILGDSLLGYKNLKANDLKVNRYTFNYFNPYVDDKYIGKSTDSLLVVKDNILPFVVAADGDIADYGYTVKEANGRIEGLKQLRRQAYKMTVPSADGTLKFGLNEENQYAVSANKEGFDAVSFYFKENNDVKRASDEKKNDFYALVVNEETIDSKAGVSDETQDATLKQQLIGEVRTSSFLIAPYDAPLYRRFNTALESAAANDGVDTLRFVEQYRNEYLQIEGNKNFTHEGIDFLGIYTDGKAPSGLAFIVDTAWMGIDTIKPQYLISIERHIEPTKEGVPCPEDGPHYDKNGKETTADKCAHATPEVPGFIFGKYLVNFKDSVKVEGNEDIYAWKKYTRVGFVKAAQVGNYLYILNGMFADVTKDTFDPVVVDAAVEAKKYAKENIIDLRGDAHKTVTWSFRYVDPAKVAEGNKKFLFESMAVNPKDEIAPVAAHWLKMQNGCLVLSGDDSKFDVFTKNDDALIFDVEYKADDEVATDAVAPEVSTISVATTDGAVIVKGAQGKKVTISNVLGQTIASTVLSSDEATIAAPAGYVTVAIEGEAAVKAIVK